MPSIEHDLQSTPPCILHLPGSDRTLWVREAVALARGQLRTEIHSLFGSAVERIEVHGPTSQLGSEFQAQKTGNSSGLIGVEIHARGVVTRAYLGYSTLGGSPALSQVFPDSVATILIQALRKAANLLESTHASSLDSSSSVHDPGPNRSEEHLA